MTLFLLLIIILCLYICILLCFLSLTFVLFHSYSNQFQIFKGKVVSFPRVVMTFPILHTFSLHLTHPFNPNLHPYPLHTYDNHKYPFSNTHSFIFLFISFQQRFLFYFTLHLLYSLYLLFHLFYSLPYKPFNSYSFILFILYTFNKPNHLHPIT